MYWFRYLLISYDLASDLYTWPRGNCNPRSRAFPNEAFWKASFPMFWTTKVGFNSFMQGQLKIWTEDSHIDFLNLTQVNISKNDSNIICTSTKVVSLCKILRVWCKDWAGHAHFNFIMFLAGNPFLLQLELFPFVSK